MAKVKITDVDKKMGAYVDDSTNMKYYNPMNNNVFTIEGLPFIKENNQYFRIPLDQEKKVTDAVWWLSGQPSGGQIRFKTNSKKITVKIKSKGDYLMCHMPKTGQQGVDLYFRLSNQRNYHFFTCAKFNAPCDEFESLIFEADGKANKDIIINLPLYEGLQEILIGIEKDSTIKKACKHKVDGKVVIYGTSVTQGGCASRPGMSFTNILSRKLDVEFVNLGFSGSGLGEIELAHIINQIENKNLVILDYEANGGATGDMEYNLEPFIDTIRNKNPEIPILVISKLPFPPVQFRQKEIDKRNKFYNIQKSMVDKKANLGDKNIYFIDGYTLYSHKDAHEFSVDGYHPTDLGFYMIAQKLYHPIKKLLKK